MIRPRIAIPLPTSTDHEYNQRSWPQYASAVERAGGEPVEVPLTLNPAAIANLVNTCQGILLPGSPADVNPQKYGQDAIEATAPVDNPRENVDELLIQDAHNLYKPILGICYGTQILNVWRGGTLIQDLTVMPVNHAAGGAVAIAHAAAVPPASLLGGLLSGGEAPLQDGFLRLPVNSSHHQAIGIPGDGLRVTARSTEDGVIEAVELTPKPQPATSNLQLPFLIGVQWHPERSYATDPASRALFSRFVAAAAAWSPQSPTIPSRLSS
jgi:putative glutamine amidotransferase